MVTRLPGINQKAVGEQCVALTLAVQRRVVELDRRMRRGEFMPSIDWLGVSSEGKTVGLVGMGHIAREYAWKMSVRIIFASLFLKFSRVISERGIPPYWCIHLPHRP